MFTFFLFLSWGLFFFVSFSGSKFTLLTYIEKGLLEISIFALYYFFLFIYLVNSLSCCHTDSTNSAKGSIHSITHNRQLSGYPPSTPNNSGDPTTQHTKHPGHYSLFPLLNYPRKLLSVFPISSLRYVLAWCNMGHWYAEYHSLWLKWMRILFLGWDYIIIKNIAYNSVDLLWGALLNFEEAKEDFKPCR